jgi:type VI protein secretion system component VasK
VPGPPRASSEPTPYDRAAGPVIDLARAIEEEEASGGAARLLAEARARLDRMERDLVRAAVPAPSVAPARLAAALLVDRAGRGRRDLPSRDWGPTAHRLLFDGEPMSEARLAEFAARAAAAGPAYAEVARFLSACLARVRAGRTRLDGPEPDGLGALALAAVAAFLVLVAVWTAWAEWSFHREARASFAAETIPLGLDRAGAVPDLPKRLDRLAVAVADLERLAARAPVRLLAGPAGFDAAGEARAAQRAAIARHAPPLLARAVDAALAQEGEEAALYDTLRAWDILSGAAEWNAGWLAGWLADRAGMFPDLAGLAPHLALLPPPGLGWGPVEPPDPELLRQARAIAAEAPEEERAWIELLRAPATTALPPFDPATRLPGLAEVMVRRSGLPVSTPLRGAFTAAGWTLARERGAGLAVQAARAEARRMFGRDLPVENDAVDRVLARLQNETLAAWEDLLADLRIRPIGTPEAGVRVTGLLARADSPLDALLRTAWDEAGGRDRARPHPLQLRIAAALGPTIQYVEGGGLDEIAMLFAALNAALGARDETEEMRVGRLMSLGDRAASLAALRRAPLVVTRLVEDVLAQTAVSHAEPETNALTRDWQEEVFALCEEAVAGRFPFDPAGPDADPAALLRLLGPGGAVDRFIAGPAAESLDTTASPWRWKPDARFQGLSPESAAFLQRAQGVGAGLFPAGALGAEMTLAALAERGRATVSLGGASAEVRAEGEPARLAWPGPDPGSGIVVSFGGEGSTAQPGPWGLLRLLSPLRLRERDEGRRFYVDLRLPAGRVFLEASFESPANPLAALPLMRGLTCPAAL